MFYTRILRRIAAGHREMSAGIKHVPDADYREETIQLPSFNCGRELLKPTS